MSKPVFSLLPKDIVRLCVFHVPLPTPIRQVCTPWAIPRTPLAVFMPSFQLPYDRFLPSTSAFTFTNSSLSLSLLLLLTHRSSHRSIIRFFVLKHDRRLALATAKMGSVYAWGVWWVSFPLSVFSPLFLNRYFLCMLVFDLDLDPGGYSFRQYSFGCEQGTHQAAPLRNFANYSSRFEAWHSG